MENIEDHLCDYGCNRKAQYKNVSGKYMCESIASKCPVNKKKNSEALKNSYKSGKRISGKDLYNGLSQDQKDKMAWNRGKYSADFSYDGSGSHKKVLIEERGHICQSCKLTSWLNEPIPLELEHCDGDNKNNVKENLLLLCPNCHAKTKFYRGRNINSGKMKVSDEDLLTSLINCNNIRQALLNVGLTPKGGNYERAKRLARLAQR